MRTTPKYYFDAVLRPKPNIIINKGIIQLHERRNQTFTFIKHGCMKMPRWGKMVDFEYGRTDCVNGLRQRLLLFMRLILVDHIWASNEVWWDLWALQIRNILSDDLFFKPMWFQTWVAVARTNACKCLYHPIPGKTRKSLCLETGKRTKSLQ